MARFLAGDEEGLHLQDEEEEGEPHAVAVGSVPSEQQLLRVRHH